MSNISNNSVCKPSSKLIFSCSGAADVGEISDRIARKLTKEGVGKMFCLAGVGGRVEPIMATTKAATKILAIDGCSMDCVKRCLQQAGFDSFQHLCITDIGMEKGKTDVTEQNIKEAAQKASVLLS